MLNKKRSVVKIGDFGISKVLSSKITSAQTVSEFHCSVTYDDVPVLFIPSFL